MVNRKSLRKSIKRLRKSIKVQNNMKRLFTKSLNKSNYAGKTKRKKRRKTQRGRRKTQRGRRKTQRGRKKRKINQDACVQVIKI